MDEGNSTIIDYYNRNVKMMRFIPVKTGHKSPFARILTRRIRLEPE